MKRWKQWTGMGLLFCLLLSACTSEKEEPASVPVPNPEPAELGQTLTVVPTESAKAAAEDPSQYQIQTRLTDFQLLSGTTGIAWGLTRNELRMYLTEDNGKTWVNISPASNVQFPDNLKYGRDLYFKDRLNGWLVRSASGTSETIVLHTSDGGGSWKVASIPDKNRVTSIFFDSNHVGWIMLTAESSTGKQDKTLYKTEDGGAKWKMVMHNYISSNQTSTQGAIPPLGYAMGMTFTSPSKGFAMIQELGVPKLYRTQDGGGEWSEGPAFFNRDKLASCSGFIPSSPEFFDTSNTEGWIPVGCQVGDSAKYNGFFTTDQGQTWTFTPFNLGWNKGVNQSLRPSFINSTQGWALVGNLVYHTEDQGKTWMPLPASRVLTSILKEYPEVGKLQFSSQRVGWMLVMKNDEMRSRLLQTIDGGITWKVL
uniref:WD40/YVTN/BNR-like repeat-containing protein n=1 Tax=Paenibacillus terrae TaxID=159743 RepID=UPI001643AE88|nr:hypothetical protein [Paenibacillus terrae]